MENQSNLLPQQQKDLDKLHQRIELQNQCIERLNTNEEIQAWFKNYNEDSVKQFINTYSFFKALWYEQGEFWIKHREKEELTWIETGWWHLAAIQQKKLFDLQCRWRAEEIQLDEVELCVDFGVWEQDIFNCPFLDPITPEEVNLYHDYIDSGDMELKDEMPFFFFFQYYEGIKKGYETENEDGYYPLWYEFYNSRKGTEYLMKLPNIRGDKESFYLALGRSTQPGKEEGLQEMKKVFTDFDKLANTTLKDRDGKPMLSAFNDKHVEAFIKDFEDKQTKEFYKAYSWANANRDEEEHMQKAIEFLIAEKKPIGVEACDDWKEAIFDAVRKCTIQKVAEHLDEAYEQYRLNLSMNIAFPAVETNPSLAARKVLKADILLGRKMNGEPEDLNF